MQVYVTLYLEFNKSFLNKQMELKKYQSEINEINKKESIVGKITKKDSSRKKELTKKINSLNEEIKIDKKNRKDAQENFQQMLDLSNNLEASKKINKLKAEIDKNKQKLIEIYKICKDKINECDKTWQENKDKMKEALLYGDDGLYQQCIVNGNLLIEEKNSFYNKYKNVIDMIEKSAIIGIKKEESIVDNKEKNDIIEIQDTIIDEFINEDYNNEKEIVEEVQPIEINEQEEINTEDDINTVQSELTTEVDNNSEILFIDDEKKDEEEIVEEVQPIEINEQEEKINFEDNENIEESIPYFSNNLANFIDYKKLIEQQSLNTDLEEKIVQTTQEILDQDENDKDDIEYINPAEIIDKAKDLASIAIQKTTSVCGKIKNVYKSGKDLTTRIMKKINFGEYEITAGYTEVLENEQIENKSRGK